MDRSVFNFHSYMLECATRLKDIGHTDASPKFFKVNTIIGLEELLNNIGIANYPALVIQTSIRGRIGDENRSNNFLDNPFYTWYIITKPLQQDFSAEQLRQAKNNAKAIGFKILAKMRHDRIRQLNGLHFMRFLSVPYQEVGPLGVGSYGVMFNFEVPDSNQLPHNEDDWLAE